MQTKTSLVKKERSLLKIGLPHPIKTHQPIVINQERMPSTENIFTIYSKDGCPYCTKVQRVLELSELKHVVFKLGRDFDRTEFYDKFGQGSTFPQVLLGETSLGGCTETVKYLRENSYV